MPSSGHQTYRDFIQEYIKKCQNDPYLLEKLNQHARTLQILWNLDLEPARPILQQGYAINPRGGKPRDPVIILRALLLSLLVGQTKINKWVKELKSCPFLRVLCGLGHDGREGVPGVGTFYDYMHRLNDGPIRKSCSHVERPSLAERRRAGSAQTRKKTKAEDNAAIKTKAGRKSLKAKRPAKRVTAELVSILNEQQLQPNANDLLDRLSHILLEVGIKISAQKGLLGELESLSVSGDGSPLVSGANRHGIKSCDCPKHKRCDCMRKYSDPDANIGWDSHRERFFHGHHIYEIVACSQKHDLPMALRLDPGSESDYVALLKTIEHLRKTCRDTNIAKLGAVMLDAGHDGEEIYLFILQHDMLPIIPLKQPAPAYHPTRKNISLSKRGVPTCPAGAEMVAWAQKGEKSVVYVCPVKGRGINVCPNAPKGVSQYRCRPVDKLAPTVTINIYDNPRLCPPLPRNHRRYKELYKLRSGSERSFSVKKLRFQLEQARHRRKSFWLIRLHLIAVLQHAMAWVSEEDTNAFIEQLLGPTAGQLAA